MNNKIFVFNTTRLKNSKKYFLPILLGVLFKLNTIALFIAPITAIKSISDGTLSPRLKIITLFIIRDLKSFYTWKIKNKIFINQKKANFVLTKSMYSNYKGKISRVDRIIKHSENFAFCGLLVLFIIFYDLQIAIIILVGGIIYYRTLIYQNYKKNPEINFFTTEYSSDKKNLSRKFNDLLNRNVRDKKILKPLISSIVMILIMTLIYLRTNSTISIIFIFLVRIYQNQMLNSIQEFVKNKTN